MCLFLLKILLLIFEIVRNVEGFERILITEYIYTFLSYVRIFELLLREKLFYLELILSLKN